MQTVNFVKPLHTDPVTTLLVHCWAADFDYNQTKDMLAKEYNVLLSRETFELLGKLLDIQLREDLN